MYEIIREDDRVIIKKGETPVFNAKKDWYLVYDKEGHATVAKVGDLTNEALLMALSNALPLKV